MILTTAAAIGITILGCGNQAKTCDLVYESTTTYQTEAACEAAIPATLIKVEDVQYPVLLAQCEAPVLAAAPMLAEPPLPVAAPIVLSEVESESPSLTSTVKSIARVPYDYVAGKAITTVETLGESASARLERAQGTLRTSLQGIEGITKATYAKVEGFILPMGDE